MSQTRDTQFLGFAVLLYKEMLNLPGRLTGDGPLAPPDYAQHIARRAYDLVQHSVGHTLEYLHECGDELAARGDMGSRIQPTIPDITDWRQWGLPDDCETKE